MFLTKEEATRINSLFSKLWSDREGVNGSWGASRHGYHPTFIRRGGLLLEGTTKLESLYVLCPVDCKVIPNYGDPRAYCSVMPTVEGEIITVTDADGVWWDILSEELVKMETEMQEHIERKSQAKALELLESQTKRQLELQLATKALTGGN